MGAKRMICLLLFGVLILVFSSCHPRHVADIKPNMTKEEVVSLWGKTPLMTSKTVNGKTTETWEYRFLNSDSVCWVTFSQDRVVATQCGPLRGRPLMVSPPPEQNRLGPPPIERGLVREGDFAIRLAETLKIGEVRSEAEGENMLASIGIIPRNGWIADYPLTPDIIGDLEKAIGRAADSGKIAMNKDEAIKAFQNLIMDMEKQYAGVEPPPGEQPYPEPYYYPGFYHYPYYYYGGYYWYYPYYYPYFYYRYWRYPYHRHWR